MQACMHARYVLVCTKPCMLRSNYVLREVPHILLIPEILCSLWYKSIWLKYGPKHARKQCVCTLACMHVLRHHSHDWLVPWDSLGLACSLDSIDALSSLIWPTLAEKWVNAHKHIACMHASLHAQVKLCAHTGLACSPDSIDTLISLIGPILAEIWSQARKHKACSHVSSQVWVVLCAQTGPAFSPDSIDTLIFLIRPNLAEIWAVACKHTACVHKSLHAQVKLCA